MMCEREMFLGLQIVFRVCCVRFNCQGDLGARKIPQGPTQWTTVEFLVGSPVVLYDLCVARQRKILPVSCHIMHQVQISQGNPRQQKQHLVPHDIRILRSTNIKRSLEWWLHPTARSRSWHAARGHNAEANARHTLLAPLIF